MKQKLLLSMLLFSTFLFSQIKFENGYFLANNNEKTECLIKNVDWKNTPSSFEYKKTESSQVEKANIKDVQEFAIYNEAKFIRSNVKIDRSGIQLNNLSQNKEPQFTDETLFLKELVNGDAVLYKYAESNQNRYFFKTKTGEIQQLIYKPYQITETQMAYNKDYKKQLRKNLNCAGITENQIEKTEYKEKDLVSLFTNYNQCIDPTNQQIIKKNTLDKFNLNIRPRVNFSTLDISNTVNMVQHDMGGKTNFGIGIELEYVLPFNRNKWAIIAEPTYQSYKSNLSKDDATVSGGKSNSMAQYSSIEIPVGFRHYMFLNNNSKLFLNAQYVADIDFGSKIEFSRADNSVYNKLAVRSQPTLAFGFGYNYKSKYAAEFRILSERRITSDYLYWTSQYKTMSLILSYNLL